MKGDDDVVNIFTNEAHVCYRLENETNVVKSISPYVVGTATIMDMPGKTGFKIVSFKYLKWHAKTLWKVVLKVANPTELYKHPISL